MCLQRVVLLVHAVCEGRVKRTKGSIVYRCMEMYIHVYILYLVHIEISIPYCELS